MYTNLYHNTGWTCQGCGAWAPHGATHVCPSCSPTPNLIPSLPPHTVNQQPPWMSIDWSLQRIAAALEQIARAFVKEELESEK